MIIFYSWDSLGSLYLLLRSVVKDYFDLNKEWFTEVRWGMFWKLFSVAQVRLLTSASRFIDWNIFGILASFWTELFLCRIWRSAKRATSFPITSSHHPPLTTCSSQLSKYSWKRIITHSHTHIHFHTSIQYGSMKSKRYFRFRKLIYFLFWIQ